MIASTHSGKGPAGASVESRSASTSLHHGQFEFLRVRMIEVGSCEGFRMPAHHEQRPHAPHAEGRQAAVEPQCKTQTLYKCAIMSRFTVHGLRPVRRAAEWSGHIDAERPGDDTCAHWVVAHVENAVPLATPHSHLSLGLDLVEFGPRSFEFIVEEPHGIKNFAEGCRCSCPVGSSEG